jgi:hypothetical protein
MVSLTTFCHLVRLAGVGGDPARVDAACGQVRAGLFQVGGLARHQHDLGAGFAQRFGHLQAQAARAAGDQRGLARQVEGVCGRWWPCRSPVCGCEQQVIVREPDRARAYFVGTVAVGAAR